MSIGVSIQPSFWDKRSGKAKGRGDDVKIVNAKIDAIRSKILRHYNHLISLKDDVSAEELKNEYLGIKEKEKTLMEVFDYHNQQMHEKVNLGIIVPKTHLRYKITKNKVQAFIQYQYKKHDIYLSKIKYQFVVDFEHYLRVKQSLCNNTAMKYIKNLKKIINMAVTHDWLVKNPFQNFKCTYHQVNKEVLTQTELDILINKDFRFERLNEIRDVFIFSCFTGFSYSDLESLAPDDVHRGLDGELWIYKNRKKTNTLERVPLLPLPLEILEKYKEHEICKSRNRLLPVKSNQKYNAFLKEVAEICGIRKKLTSHIARHTFATTVLLANKVPMEVVKELLGHKDIQTTQIYAKVLQDNISNEMRRLKTFYIERKNKNLNQKSQGYV